ncbi:hypothetical protein UY3_06621 [Chelonia mydas]|uniref:Uncharacterized protein n=1 Tax=Chelonia mydas TaxID=8469 RepID=M7BKC5_CHEMY|nr:hypothetical protein UY3_06621 [Chelonia mydas]
MKKKKKEEEEKTGSSCLQMNLCSLGNVPWLLVVDILIERCAHELLVLQRAGRHTRWRPHLHCEGHCEYFGGSHASRSELSQEEEILDENVEWDLEAEDDSEVRDACSQELFSTLEESSQSQELAKHKQERRWEPGWLPFKPEGKEPLSQPEWAGPDQAYSNPQKGRSGTGSTKGGSLSPIRAAPGRETDTDCRLFPSDPAAKPGEALGQEKPDLVEGLGLPAAKYVEELEEPGSNPGQCEPDAEGELKLPTAEYPDELEGPEGPTRETGTEYELPTGRCENDTPPSNVSYIDLKQCPQRRYVSGRRSPADIASTSCGDGVIMAMEECSSVGIARLHQTRYSGAVALVHVCWCSVVE